MNEQRLKKLLRRGDGEGAGLHNEFAFAAKVRYVAMQRRTRRRVARVLAVTAAVGAMGWCGVMIFGQHRSARPMLFATKDGPRVVEIMPKASSEIDALQVLDPVWQAREEAACTMVFMAQRREARVSKEETKDQYTRVIALFPESHWAEVARNETQRLEKQN